MKPKNIGIIHYQVGHTDGVSLEIEKWQRIFEEMGHTVSLCAGDLGTAKGTLIPEIYHHRQDVTQLAHNTFKELRDFDESGYQAELQRQVSVLTKKLRAWIVAEQIELLVAQNVWCVGASPSLAVALEKIRQEFGIPAIAHHHDFYWERGDDKSLTCDAAKDVASNYLPPTSPDIQHVVINSLAQRQLEERKGVTARVVPNIFDFDAPDWKKDDFNSDFRAAIGVEENDLLILQATRIVTRKGIELAIDLVREVQALRSVLEENGLYDGRPFTPENRIVLVLAGYARDDATGAYVRKLKEKAAADGVELLFIEEWIANERGEQNEHKVYSLWDAYVFADLVTYPSLWEGWGNQFLEALRAELPVVIFEYPVYKADIAAKGFDAISLGSEISGYDDTGLAQVPTEIIVKAAKESIASLTNSTIRQKIVRRNLEIAKENYSLHTLRKILSEEIAKI
jgi:glycosyltransferase involved in cell wall biosynthesis